MNDNSTIYDYDVALSTYDGKTTTLSNFRAATALDAYPALTKLKLKLLQSIACAVLPSSTNNTIVALSASQFSKSIDLAVNPMTTPIQTPSAPAAASVGVASGAVLSANSARRHVVFVNTSAATISLGFGAAAVLNSGITLMANGGSYEMSAQQGNLYLGEIRAIASVAASNLSIQEDA